MRAKRIRSRQIKSHYCALSLRPSGSRVLEDRTRCAVVRLSRSGNAVPSPRPFRGREFRRSQNAGGGEEENPRGPNLPVRGKSDGHKVVGLASDVSPRDTDTLVPRAPDSRRTGDATLGEAAGLPTGRHVSYASADSACSISDGPSTALLTDAPPRIEATLLRASEARCALTRARTRIPADPGPQRCEIRKSLHPPMVPIRKSLVPISPRRSTPRGDGRGGERPEGRRLRFKRKADFSGFFFQPNCRHFRRGGRGMPSYMRVCESRGRS